jgi:hypothetical protein
LLSNIIEDYSGKPPARHLVSADSLHGAGGDSHIDKDNNTIDFYAKNPTLW